MTCCPTCGGTGYVDADGLIMSPTERRLRNECEKKHRRISPDGRVSEHDAARLFEKPIGTVRRWRREAEEEGRPMPVVQIGGRWYWRIAGIAAMLDGSDGNGTKEHKRR